MFMNVFVSFIVHTCTYTPFPLHWRIVIAAFIYVYFIFHVEWIIKESVFSSLHLREINCQHKRIGLFSNTHSHTHSTFPIQKCIEKCQRFLLLLLLLFARLLPIRMPTQCTQRWIKVSYSMNIRRLVCADMLFAFISMRCRCHKI